MIHIMFAIRDSAAETFHPPFCARATGQATRDFTAQVNRQAPDNPLYQHPDDFELYRVGEYNDATGEIKPQPPALILRGKDTITNPHSA